MQGISSSMRVLDCSHLIRDGFDMKESDARASSCTGVLTMPAIMRWKARRMLPRCRRGFSVNSIKDSITGDRKVSFIGSIRFHLHLQYYFDSHQSRCILEDNFNYVLNPIKVPAEWESWKKKRRACAGD